MTTISVSPLREHLHLGLPEHMTLLLSYDEQRLWLWLELGSLQSLVVIQLVLLVSSHWSLLLPLPSLLLSLRSSLLLLPRLPHLRTPALAPMDRERAQAASHCGLV
jgi:hypothetical protein